MSTVSLRFPHRLPPEQLRTKIDGLLETLKSRSPYFEQVEPVWSGDGRRCDFRGEGFSGWITLLEEEIGVEMELEGYLVMFRPVVEQKLRELVEKELGSAAGS